MYKVIFSTVLTTIVVVFISASMFLNSILSIFGLEATSVVTLNNLKESKKIVNKIRARNKAKKIEISKKFVKRTSKKVASSAVSAATIGTAAVVITVAGLEVYDYCDEKREIQEESNILFNEKKEFNYNECLTEASKDSTKIIASVKKAIPGIASKTWESTKNISNETWESTKKIGSETWNSTSEASEKLWNSLSDLVK